MNKYLKRGATIALTGAMCLSMAACGDKGGSKDSKNETKTLAQELGYGYLSEYHELDTDLDWINSNNVTTVQGKMYFAGQYYDDAAGQSGVRLYCADPATGEVTEIPMTALESTDTSSQNLQALTVSPDGGSYWTIIDTYTYSTDGADATMTEDGAAADPAGEPVAEATEETAEAPAEETAADEAASAEEAEAPVDETAEAEGNTEGSAIDEGIDNPEGVHFFSLVARGAGKDIGACLSLIFGVLTTQTYAQAVISCKSDACARKGAVMSAFLIPPIGIGGILVGLYMRATHPGIVAKTALTSFVMEHMPPVLAGIVMGTLFVAVVGTGAGLALGISFIVNKDIIKKFTHKLDNNPRLEAIVGKIITAAVLLLGCCLSTGSLGDTILQFAFMSMGLRGAVVLVPMCCALWLPGKIPHKFAMCSIIVAPLLVLVFGVLNVLPFDALFIGIAASLVIMAVGYLVGRNRQPLGAK